MPATIAADVPVLAIDGPSGSGKGTVSRIVAQRLGWRLLDSGALYRLVALAGLQRGLEPQDVPGHAALADAMDVVFGADGAGDEQVLLSGRDVSREIRQEEVGQGASRVAAWPPVRAALLERQRRFAKSRRNTLPKCRPEYSRLCSAAVDSMLRENPLWTSSLQSETWRLSSRNTHKARCRSTPCFSFAPKHRTSPAR